MSIWIFLRRWLLRRFTQLSGRTVAVFVFSYLLSSWLFLSLAGEQALTSSFTDFVYYLMVTASTVGYGDMSPTTPAGKWIVALWVIPGGLSLFAMGIGQIASLFLDVWQHQLKGRRSLTVQNHYLVLGWNDQRTLHLINLLQHGEHGNRSIVLAVRPEMDNPLPGEIEFVRVPSFTDKAGMDKTNVAQASTIIIDNPEDDITLSAILYCVNQNPDAHILAYFQDESIANLARQHCPNVECVPSVSVEMLAKAAVDPGSSSLHHELLSTSIGMTQYSIAYPDKPDTTVGDLFTGLKQQHEATLIGIDFGNGIKINPPVSDTVKAGNRIYYIAPKRIKAL